MDKLNIEDGIIIKYDIKNKDKYKSHDIKVIPIWK